MLTHRFFKKFHFAATKEMIELKKRRTFQLMKKTSNQNRTLFIWAFKYKFDANKYVKKFKTWLCFKNDLQMTHQNTYMTALAARTFRVLMIIFAAFDLDVWQYNAVNAFINNFIDEKTFNECFEDFTVFDHFWKLQKALYNLRQVSILWYENFTNDLKNLELILVLEVNCHVMIMLIILMSAKATHTNKTVTWLKLCETNYSRKIKW
jgi:hypothetical protein